MMTKQSNLNAKGFSLVEVMVAIGILGVIIAGVIGMQSFILKQSQSTLQRSTLLKVLHLLQEDLFKNIEGLPLRDNVAFLNGNTLNKSDYEASFDSSDAQNICYDKNVQTVLDSDPLCEFRVSYYRVLEIDRSYSGNAAVAGTSFQNIPMSRLLVRVRFTDKASNSERILYFSRLKTHVLSF